MNTKPKNLIKKMMYGHKGSDSVLIQWDGVLTASPFNYKTRKCFYSFCAPTPSEVKEYKGKKWYAGEFPAEIVRLIKNRSSNQPNQKPMNKKQWEIEVCFETSADKDTNEFMTLLENKIYEVIDEIAPESSRMSVFKIENQ